MRTEPTLRIPLGVLGMLAGLALYALFVAWLADWIGQLHVLLQTVVYLVLGIVWIFPAYRLVIWMETGRWRIRK